MLDMFNRTHTNPENKNIRKDMTWILIDSIIIGLIAMGAAMPSTIPGKLDLWVMFKAFFIAFILQLAVERGLKKPEGGT